MIKVRVVRGVQVATGLFALGSGLAACAVEPENDESFEETESGYTVSDPGTGVFFLDWAYAAPTGYSFNTRGSVDEFVRARQKMSFSIPAHYLWSHLYPTEGTPDVARLKQLNVKVRALHVKNGATYAPKTLTANGWENDQPWSVAATTGEFTISPTAQAVRFELTITDDAAPGKKVVVGADQFIEVPVVGGSVPNKTLLFDNNGQSLRHRILEGGRAVKGTNLAIAYTDWRAGTLVDGITIDRHIGTQKSFGRFGPVEVPIYGDVEYEISYGYAIDDVWTAEAPLTANAKPRLLWNLGSPSNRVAFEGSIAIPKSAQNLQMYFHVKAFVKVDYAKYPNVTWRRYEDGTRLLVREAWDNENGAFQDNYDFPTEKR